MTTTPNTSAPNEPTGAIYRIETLSDMLALPPRRVGHMLTDLTLWLASGQAVRDHVTESGGTVVMPEAMDWHDDGAHIGGVRMTDKAGATIMEMKFDAKALGLVAGNPTPTPTPTNSDASTMADRLQTMAGQVEGFASTVCGHEARELTSLAGALEDLSAEARRLQMSLDAMSGLLATARAGHRLKPEWDSNR